MTLDPKINQAIIGASHNYNQSEELTRRLLAWISALLDGNEKLSDPDSRDRHLELIYDATKPTNEPKE